MHYRSSALLSVFLSFIATSALAESAIEQRQATFKNMKETVAALKDQLKEPDYDKARTQAESILEDAKAVTELFPEGSYEGDTRAKKKIWEKYDDFQARQQTLIDHAEELLAATDSDDKKQLKSAFKTLSKDCKGCHMRYRQVF